MRSASSKISSRPKKHLGQNFLINEHTIDRIILNCGFQKDDVVLEIGPGLGALTKRLAGKVKKVYAIETDRELFETLQGQLSQESVELIKADVLKYDFRKLPGNLKLVANLPYNISTPILEKLIDHISQFTAIFLTVQLEFGRRLAAQPNSKDYGSLSCFAQYHAEVKVLFKIPNSCFRPIPKVDSCFLKIQPRPAILPARDEKALFQFIQNAFQQRRKKISNALGVSIAPEQLTPILQKLNLSENLRPENLSLKNFVDITNAWLETR